MEFEIRYYGLCRRLWAVTDSEGLPSLADIEANLIGSRNYPHRFGPAGFITIHRVGEPTQTEYHFSRCRRQIARHIVPHNYNTSNYFQPTNRER